MDKIEIPSTPKRHHDADMSDDDDLLDEDTMIEMKSEALARGVDTEQVKREWYEEREMDAGLKIPVVTGRQRKKMLKDAVVGFSMSAMRMQRGERPEFKFVKALTDKLEETNGSRPEAIIMPLPLSPAFKMGQISVSVSIPGRKDYNKSGIQTRLYRSGDEPGDVPIGTRVRVIDFGQMGPKTKLFVGSSGQNVPFEVKIGNQKYVMVVDQNDLASLTNTGKGLSTPIFQHFLWGRAFGGDLVRDADANDILGADVIIVLSFTPYRLKYVTFVDISKSVPMQVGAEQQREETREQQTVPYQPSQLIEPYPLRKRPTVNKTQEYSEKVKLDALLSEGDIYDLFGRDSVTMMKTDTRLSSRVENVIGSSINQIGEFGALMLKEGTSRDISDNIERFTLFTLKHTEMLSLQGGDLMHMETRQHLRTVLLQMSSLLRSRFVEWSRLVRENDADQDLMRSFAFWSTAGGGKEDMANTDGGIDGTYGMASPDIIANVFSRRDENPQDSFRIKDRVATLRRSLENMSNDESGELGQLLGTQHMTSKIALTITRLLFVYNPDPGTSNKWGFRILAMIIALQVVGVYMGLSGTVKRVNEENIREILTPYATAPKTVKDLLDLELDI